MLNYIKGEFYQIRHNKSFLCFVGVLAALIAAAIGLFKYLDIRFHENDASFSMLYTSVSFIFAAVIMTAGYLENNELMRHHTIKNSVAFGISRWKIYTGKFISQLAACTLIYVGLAVFYAALSCLIMGVPQSGEFFRLARALAGGYPLCVSCLAVSFCFITNLGAGWFGIMTTFGVLYIIPNIFHYLSMKFPWMEVIHKWSPSNMAGSQVNAEGSFYFWESASGMAHCWLTGLIGTLLFAAIGIYWFQKREIR